MEQVLSQEIENYIKRWGHPNEPLIEQDVNSLIVDKIVGDSVLDICCGLGHLVYYLKKKENAASLTYLGIDISDERVVFAKGAFPDWNFIKEDFCNTVNIPICDTVVCSRTLGHGTCAYSEDEYFYVLMKLWSRVGKRLIITLPSPSSLVFKFGWIVSRLPNVLSVEKFTTTYGARGFAEDFMVIVLDKSKRNVLDLGCGLTDTFKDSTHCLDYSCGDANKFEMFRDFVENKKGKAYVDWDMNKLPLPFDDNLFEGIYMKHVFEHFSFVNGNKLLTDVSRILLPGGFLYIEVPDALWLAEQIVKDPNINMSTIPEKCGAPILDYLYGVQKEGKCEKGCCNPDYGLHLHKCAYTQATLTDMLERNNFKVVSVDRGRDVDMKIMAVKK